MDQFADEIRARWPDIDDLPDEEVDDSPWSIGFDVSPAYMVVSFVWSRVDHAVPIFVEAAKKHGLYVFDPQEDALQLPTGERITWRGIAPTIGSSPTLQLGIELTKRGGSAGVPSARRISKVNIRPRCSSGPDNTASVNQSEMPICMRP